MSGVTAYIGVGSNLNDPAAQVQTAITAIAGIDNTSVTATSSLYMSPPMGPPDQPKYINAVVACATTLDSTTLLRALQAIEHDHGRVRDGVRWGPRVLDLDLLIFGDEKSDDPALILPHPGIADRAFVIVPLAEIEPDLTLPDGRRAQVAANDFSPDDVWQVNSD